MAVTTLRSPGPKAIDALATGARIDIGNRFVRRDLLVEKFQETHDRVKTVTNIATGNWHVEWPDLSRSPEAPTVANLVEVGIAHWSSLFGSVLPSFKVPVNATADRTQAKRGARKRERRIRELWRISNVSELAAEWGGDYAGAGFGVGMVWADFGQPDPGKRDPYMMRIDPRHAFLLKDNLGNITELLVARKISMQELRNMWVVDNPDYLQLFADSKEDDVEEWFWMDKETIMYAIVDMSKKGRDANRNVVLTHVPNELGFVPAAEAPRPTFDGQRRGHFDQTIHILRTMHRLQVMMIHSTEEHSYPAIAAFDVANADEFGPGAIMELLSPEAHVERLGPSAHFDVKDTIARLGDEARTTSSLPQQLFGEPGASIVSARGINAAMGALDARLAVAHSQFALFFGKMSGFLLAFDEVYCDGDKSIIGDSQDDEDSESFRPSRDINGAWQVDCTYGLGAGSDPANTEMRLHMHLNGRLISRETAREELPFLKDPDGENVKLFREQMFDALVAGILAKASDLGDPTMAAKALELLNTDDIDFDKVVQDLVEFIGKPPEAPPGAEGGGALGAVEGAESLARGGQPGQAADQPARPPGLPPLGQIMGPGRPNQVA